MVSPVNWVYSFRNALDDWGAPRPVVEWLSLESPIPLAAFTAFDWLHQRAGAPRSCARSCAATPTTRAVSATRPGDHHRAGRRDRWRHRRARRDARAAPQRARRRALRGRRRGRRHGRQPPRRRGLHVRHRRALHHQPARDRDRRRTTSAATSSATARPCGSTGAATTTRPACCGSRASSASALAETSQAPPRRAGHRGRLVPPRVRRRARRRDRAPLVEAWSGAPATELSPAVADKIPSSIAETIGLDGRGPPDPSRGRDRLLPRGPAERQRLARLPRARRSRPCASSLAARGRRLGPAQQPGRAHHRERGPRRRRAGRRPAGARGRGHQHRADQRAPPARRRHRRARAVPRVPLPADGVRRTCGSGAGACSPTR